MGVPPVIIHLYEIFPYKPTIWGYPQLWKPLYIIPIQHADCHEFCSSPCDLLHCHGDFGYDKQLATGGVMACWPGNTDTISSAVVNMWGFPKTHLDHGSV